MHFFRHMRITVEREARFCVSEFLCQRLFIHADGNRMGGIGMPQAVERDVGKPRFPDDSLEGTVCRVGIDRFFRVAQARKNPFGADGFLALFQHADNAFGQDNRADTGVGFRIADRDSAPDRNDLTCHAELAFRFIEVLPAQSADFTLAQSRHTFEVKEVAPPRFILNDFQKLFELFLVVDFAFRAVRRGDCCAVGRIFYDDTTRLFIYPAEIERVIGKLSIRFLKIRLTIS